MKVPTLTISGLRSGSLRTKSHLDVRPLGNHRIYYKEEGGGFPQIQAVMNLVCLSCPWLILAPKVLQLCTNHFVLVLCRPVWVSKAYQFFLVPSQSSNTPLYPSKVLWAKERAPILYSSALFYLGLTFESFKELGARQGLQLPKWKLPWECEGSFPHTFVHSREHDVWLLGFPLSPQPCKPLLWSRTQG